MTPLEIKMLKAGITQQAVADSFGVTRQAVYRVITGRSVSGRIRRGVAESIGRSVKNIWPDAADNDPVTDSACA